MTAGLGAALGILGIGSIMDIRKRTVSLILVWSCMAAGSVWQIVFQQTELWELVLSLFPGIVLISLAWLTEEKIGYGDGWIVMTAGIWTGIWDVFLILTGGMMLCGLYSGILLSLRKIRRNDTLPFLPFLFVGCVGRILF